MQESIVTKKLGYNHLGSWQHPWCQENGRERCVGTSLPYQDCWVAE